MGREIDVGMAVLVENMLDVFFSEKVAFDEMTIEQFFSRVVLELVSKP